MAGPLAMSLAALLAAMLLERLLRLFDLAASAGVAFSSALVVASNLVPHYLGLALPLAFTAAMFAAVARMSDDNELDVMLAVGRSMARISAPYFVLGVMLSVFNLYLFGQLQPLTRYYYHVAIDQMLQTSWDARLEENRFIDTGRGFSFSADAVETGSRRLHGVFIERRYPVAEEITTAANGQIDMAPNGRGPMLRLDKGQIVRERRDGTVAVMQFENGEVFDIVPATAPFRPRGDAIRERTMGELWADMHRPRPHRPTARRWTRRPGPARWRWPKRSRPAAPTNRRRPPLPKPPPSSTAGWHARCCRRCCRCSRCRWAWPPNGAAGRRA